MLVSTVELFWRARKAAGLGLTGVASLGLDWPAIISRKNSIVQSWSKGKAASLEALGIRILRGAARFRTPNEIELNSETLSAKLFVIATGSSPARLSIPGAKWAIDSDGFLEMKERPGEMVIVGGGPIALEFAFCLARAGTGVILLQKGPSILPRVDSEMRGALVDLGRQAGISIHTEVDVTGITKDHAVHAQTQGRAETFKGDAVLLAAGRLPNTLSLALDQAGVESKDGFVQVNEFLQSVSAPHIYAAGDAADRRQHTPIAWYEGSLAARNALEGNKETVDLTFLPTALFTIPALAQVGITEDQARSAGIEYGVNRMPMEHNPAAGVREETEGQVKVIYEKKSEKILGVHVLGAHAEDIIHIAMMAMKAGIKRPELGAMLYVFPTLAGAMFDATAAG